MFEIQGAVSTVGEHLVNPDCVTTSSTAAELYYSKQQAFALLPCIIVLISFLIWYLYGKKIKVDFFAKRKSKDDTTLKDKFVVTVTSVMYLLYPTLCKNAFGMFDCKWIGNTQYLKADLEEECYIGRHLTAVWTVGVSQLIMYVIGLPCVVLFFLYRNREHLEDRVVQTRYGLFYSGYKPTRFFWETIITARKVAVVALSVFGPELGPEKQALVALLILLICIVFEIYGDPFHEVTARHKILARVETSSLLIEWWTMWSGLIIFQLAQESAVGVLLTISVVIGNLVLFGWAIFKFIRQKVYERKAQKIKDDGEKRRSRMESIDVTSFSNPSLDAKTIAKTNKEDAGDIELTTNSSHPTHKLRPKKLISKKKTLLSKKKKKKKGDDDNNNNTKKKKVKKGTDEKPRKRRLSSRELIQQADGGSVQQNNETETTTVSIGECKTTSNNTTASKASSKQRVRRLSKVMNSRKNSKSGDMNEPVTGITTEDTAVLAPTENEVEIITDESTGKRYSYDNSTGETKWVDETDTTEIDIVVDESTGRRFSCNKSTGETKWMD